MMLVVTGSFNAAIEPAAFHRALGSLAPMPLQHRKMMKMVILMMMMVLVVRIYLLLRPPPSLSPPVFARFAPTALPRRPHFQHHPRHRLSLLQSHTAACMYAFGSEHTHTHAHASHIKKAKCHVKMVHQKPVFNLVKNVDIIVVNVLQVCLCPMDFYNCTKIEIFFI